MEQDGVLLAASSTSGSHFLIVYAFESDAEQGWRGLYCFVGH
jgi:hypothetical protein